MSFSSANFPQICLMLEDHKACILSWTSWGCGHDSRVGRQVKVVPIPICRGREDLFQEQYRVLLLLLRVSAVRIHLNLRSVDVDLRQQQISLVAVHCF